MCSGGDTNAPTISDEFLRPLIKLMQKIDIAAGSAISIISVNRQ
jgi:hypothetical protein